MATLTSDQIEYIRAVTGDDCEPYDVSDTLMQKLFDRASADECLTIVEALRIRVAKASNLVEESRSDGESRKLNQKASQLTTLLKQWSADCDVGEFTLDMGVLDQAIDTDCETEY